jgi:hypothetical protein
MSTEPKVPKYVFIVPYRNRVQHKFFFSKYMSFILEDHDDYEIYFSHQCDSRTFNRGATKNIGFLAVKNKYPDHYKNINFVFNDVDTIPFNKIFNYETVEGVVKHFYGFKYALGGIIVFKGSDFEKTNGFPCFWGWGMEDNALQKRCDAYNLKIDRSVFYEIGNPQILQLFDGVSRIISGNDYSRMETDNGLDGIRTIHKLDYTLDSKSENPNDNIFTVHNPRIFFINISTFMTYVKFENDKYYNYDLREPKEKIINPDKLRETKNTVVSTNNWSNIPYYPTTRERRENLAKQIIQTGKQVPNTLLRQMENDARQAIINDSFNNFNIDKPPQPPQPPPQQRQLQPQQRQLQPQQRQLQPQQRQLQPQQRQLQPQQRPHTIPNKFSREYANAVGQKPRAQASARVGLGGVF